MTVQNSLVKRYLPYVKMGYKYETCDWIPYSQQDILQVPWYTTWIQQYVFLLVYEQST